MNQTGKTAFFFGLLLILSGVYGILQPSDNSNGWTMSDEGLPSYSERGISFTR